MIKLTKVQGGPAEDIVKSMSDMMPTEVCILTSGVWKGHIVMKTSNPSSGEVRDLTEGDRYWSQPKSGIMVRELRKGETYNLELS